MSHVRTPLPALVEEQALPAAQVNGLPPLDGLLLPQGGAALRIEFVSELAAFSNTLAFVRENSLFGTKTAGVLFGNTNTTAPGTIVDLPPLGSHETIRFYLISQGADRFPDLATRSSDQLVTFLESRQAGVFSTDGAHSSDGAVHAVAGREGLNTLIGFEDLPFPGSDADFNDLLIRVSPVLNTVPTANPIGDPTAVTIPGTPNNDVLVGTAAREILDGQVGDDRLIGATNSDAMIGGNGNDTLVWNNGDGSDFMQGGPGFDTTEVNGAPAADFFFARTEAGQAVFSRTNLGLFTLGLDTVEILEVNGLAGDDTFRVDGLNGTGVTKVIFHGDAGKDVLIAPTSGVPVDAEGGVDDDDLTGSPFADVLQGGIGNDIILGLQGNDIMLGNEGDDILIWTNGDGSDVMRGGTGIDTVRVEGADGAGDRFELGADPAVGTGGALFQRTNLGLFSLDVTEVEQFLISGNRGDDTITVKNLAGVASVTSVILEGNEGADSFVFEAANTQFAAILGFNRAEGDAIRVSSVLTGFSPGTSNINDFVSLSFAGGNTTLRVDPNGAVGGASFSDLVRLEAVDLTGQTAQSLLTSGTLLVA